MKKILFLSIFLLGLYNAIGQNYYMTVPEGYGAETTGGAGGTIVTVSTYTNLVTQLKSVGPKIILVSGVINFSSTQLQISEVVINKTIIGLPGAKLVNTKRTITSTPPSASDVTTSSKNSGILNLKPTSNNVIIRNLIFQGPGAFDCDGRDNLTADGTTKLWVDHCEFQDAIDGNFDIKGLSDKITISWCKFTYLLPPTKRSASGFTDDHRFSNLVGSDQSDYPTDGRYSITFKNCYWADGCRERMPRARNAELHILNCYYNTTAPSSVAIGLGGGDKGSTCYVENTDFAKVVTTLKNYNSTDGGAYTTRSIGCVKGIPSAVIPNSGTATKPIYPYTVLPVADVVTYVPNVNCGAGATLSVTPTGIISSPCDKLGVDDNVLNADIKLYPTFVDTTINIDLPDSISGNAIIDIHSITGEKVYSYSKDVTPAEKLSINVANLSEGLYICTLKINNSSTSWKFIKK